MSPSSTVYGGQHDSTKYVTFELLSHASLVADKIWGIMLEPARTMECGRQQNRNRLAVDCAEYCSLQGETQKRSRVRDLYTSAKHIYPVIYSRAVVAEGGEESTM